MVGGAWVYRPKRTRCDIIFDVCLYFLMVILLVIFLYPIWDTIVVSLSSPKFVKKLGLRLLPDDFTLASYKEVFKDDIIAIGYMNTLIRVIIGTTLTVLITYCGGYALTKKSLPFRRTILLFILFTMFFSGGLIPSYLLMKKLGLIGSRWALILPMTTSAWNLIIARNFIKTIPESLEESAFIDGAHPLIVVFRIMMPLSMPIIAVLALWSAVGHWNSWFDALIYVRSRDKMVLQLVLRKILIDQDEELMKGGALVFMQDDTSPETVKAATIIVSIAPIICFYPFLQKYFVKGVLIGSVKG